MTFAPVLDVALLDAKHPEYAANEATWRDIDLLYSDGAVLRANAARFLKRKPKELSAVWRARLDRFTSRPILGTALGWYQAAMFGGNPSVRVERGGGASEDYADFLAECDGGKTFVDFSRDIFLSLLKSQSSWVLVDREPTEREYSSLAEQRASGALDAHLMRYDLLQVINWSCDAAGEIEWVVVAVQDAVRGFATKDKIVDRWYYFDRSVCVEYEAERDANGKARQARMVGNPRPHALSAVGRVPLRRIAVPEGLWLGNRAYLSACTHLDLVNALDWGIFNGCLPTLWVKGYRDDPSRSEVGYIELEDGGDIGYLEPSGATFDLAMRNIDGWREEMFRQVYLQSQGRSTSATASAQSGFSKEMDMLPGQDVLNGLADFLRAGLLAVLRDVADARGDAEVSFSITGLEFEANDAEDIRRDQTFLDSRLGKTVEVEVKKRLAGRALSDAPQGLRDQAYAEIEAMKTDEEAARESLQNRAAAAFGA